MSRIIAGHFDDVENVEAAIQDLVSRGFRRGEYASYYLNPPGQHGLSPIGGDAASDEGAREAGKGAATGAAIGGAAGLAIGSIGGPPGALAGAGVGAYVGSLAGALRKTREPHAEAASPQHPAEPFAGPMVAVCVDRSGAEAAAVEALDGHGAREIHRAEGEWRDGEWVDYDPRVPAETVKKAAPPGASTGPAEDDKP